MATTFIANVTPPALLRPLPPIASLPPSPSPVPPLVPISPTPLPHTTATSKASATFPTVPLPPPQTSHCHNLQHSPPASLTSTPLSPSLLPPALLSLTQCQHHHYCSYHYRYTTSPPPLSCTGPTDIHVHCKIITKNNIINRSLPSHSSSMWVWWQGENA